jgi:hypothetical protein
MASTYLLKKFKNIENISNANADFNKELLRGNCNLVEVGLGNDNKSEEHYLPKKIIPNITRGINKIDLIPQDQEKKIKLEAKKEYLNNYDKPKEK